MQMVVHGRDDEEAGNGQPTRPVSITDTGPILTITVFVLNALLAPALIGIPGMLSVLPLIKWERNPAAGCCLDTRASVDDAQVNIDMYRWAKIATVWWLLWFLGCFIWFVSWVYTWYRSYEAMVTRMPLFLAFYVYFILQAWYTIRLGSLARRPPRTEAGNGQPTRPVSITDTGAILTITVFVLNALLAPALIGIPGMLSVLPLIKWERNPAAGCCLDTRASVDDAQVNIDMYRWAKIATVWWLLWFLGCFIWFWGWMLLYSYDCGYCFQVHAMVLPLPLFLAFFIYFILQAWYTIRLGRLMAARYSGGRLMDGHVASDVIRGGSMQLMGADGRAINAPLRKHIANHIKAAGGLFDLIEHSNASSKFSSNIQQLILGQPQDAALGINHFMRVADTNVLYRKLSDGIGAISAEVEQHGTADDKLLLEYILRGRAGSESRTFDNGVMDQGRNGETLDHFVQHNESRIAQLEAHHVVSLRLYTTKAFESLNNPFRGDGSTPHPFPATINFLMEGIRKLRAVGGQGRAANNTVDLWRGMKDVAVHDRFVRDGGTEKAPMSTTTDLGVALQFARSEHA